MQKELSQLQHTNHCCLNNSSLIWYCMLQLVTVPMRIASFVQTLHLSTENISSCNMTYFTISALRQVLNSNPQTIKDALVQRCAQILSCYRQHCATPSTSGQLILPECMKLLPLYMNSLVKSDVIAGGKKGKYFIVLRFSFHHNQILFSNSPVFIGDLSIQINTRLIRISNPHFGKYYYYWILKLYTMENLPKRTFFLDFLIL